MFLLFEKRKIFLKLFFLFLVIGVFGFALSASATICCDGSLAWVNLMDNVCETCNNCRVDQGYTPLEMYPNSGAACVNPMTQTPGTCGAGNCTSTPSSPISPTPDCGTCEATEAGSFIWQPGGWVNVLDLCKNGTCTITYCMDSMDNPGYYGPVTLVIPDNETNQDIANKKCPADCGPMVDISGGDKSLTDECKGDKQASYGQHTNSYCSCVLQEQCTAENCGGYCTPLDECKFFSIESQIQAIAAAAAAAGVCPDDVCEENELKPPNCEPRPNAVQEKYKCVVSKCGGKVLKQSINYNEVVPDPICQPTSNDANGNPQCKAHCRIDPACEPPGAPPGSPCFCPPYCNQVKTWEEVAECPSNNALTGETRCGPDGVQNRVSCNKCDLSKCIDNNGNPVLTDAMGSKCKKWIGFGIGDNFNWGYCKIDINGNCKVDPNCTIIVTLQGAKCKLPGQTDAQATPLEDHFVPAEGDCTFKPSTCCGGKTLVWEDDPNQKCDGKCHPITGPGAYQCSGSSIISNYECCKCITDNNGNPKCECSVISQKVMDCGPTQNISVPYCWGGVQCTFNVNYPGTCTTVLPGGVPSCVGMTISIICNGACASGGGGGNEPPADPNNPDYPVYHNACNAQYQCLPVLGAGSDLCGFLSTTDSGCSHKQCVSGKCTLVPGPVNLSGLGANANACSVDNDCSHNECSGGQCVSVEGQGTNSCQTDSNCVGSAGISVCNRQHKCAFSPDSLGFDLCSSDADCANSAFHNLCNSAHQCVVVAEPGIDACASDTDCQQILMHAECSQYHQCIMVPGLGANQCVNDADCILKCNAQKQCVKGGTGAPCSTTADCLLKRCDSQCKCSENGTGGICSTDLNCANCNPVPRCDLQHKCVMGGTGKECSADGQCDLTFTHNICNDQSQCVSVNFGGTDWCGGDTGLDCAHNICDSVTQSCKVVSGESSDDCQTSADCLRCNDASQCVFNGFVGPNPGFSCSTGSDCAPRNCNPITQTCVVGGSGASCTTDQECVVVLPTHKECQNQQCVSVSGVGADECSINNDCLPKRCNELKQCVPGGYGGHCATDSDCNNITKRCKDKVCEEIYGLPDGYVCSENLNCVETHSNCIGAGEFAYCQIFAGPATQGENTCSSDTDCTTHFECNTSKQCAEVFGGNAINTCSSDADCSFTHNECSGAQCVVVNSEGINLCGPIPGLGVVDCVHTECSIAGKCQEVAGAGEDLCSSDADCAENHNICNIQKQCKNISGAGQNECFANIDCQLGHTECFEEVSGASYCAFINTPGIDLCGPLIGIDCATNYCLSQKCVSYGTGSVCNSDADCEMRCNGSHQCVEGGSGNSCINNLDCYESTHKECQNYQCLEVQGQGVDQCALNIQCTKRCNFGAQTCEVGGDGPVCSTDDQCKPRCQAFHNECVNKACISVKGGGPDECRSNMDCLPSCNTSHQCVTGGSTIFGGLACGSSTDCIFTHSVCSDGKCQVVAGCNIQENIDNKDCSSEDQCQTDDDCNPQPSSPCESKKCSGDGQCVYGGTGPECSENSECVLRCSADFQCIFGGVGAKCSTSADCVSENGSYPGTNIGEPEDNCFLIGSSVVVPDGCLSCSGATELNLLLEKAALFDPPITEEQFASLGVLWTAIRCPGYIEGYEDFFEPAEAYSSHYQCVADGDGPTCSVDNDCMPKCNTAGQCVVGGTGAYCSADKECQPARCNDCGQCKKGGTGKLCASAEDCLKKCNYTTKQCDENGTGDVCTSAEDCTKCNDQCQCVFTENGPSCPDTAFCNTICNISHTECNTDCQCELILIPGINLCGDNTELTCPQESCCVSIEKCSWSECLNGITSGTCSDGCGNIWTTSETCNCINGLCCNGPDCCVGENCPCAEGGIICCEGPDCCIGNGCCVGSTCCNGPDCCVGEDCCEGNACCEGPDCCMGEGCC